MIISKQVNPDYENYSYSYTIETDSCFERDIIEKYLAQAQEEYSNLLRTYTKPLSDAKVVYATRVDGDEEWRNKIKEKFSYIFCKCDMLIFFEAENSKRYRVKCPNPACNYIHTVLVHKGDRNE